MSHSPTLSMHSQTASTSSLATIRSPSQAGLKHSNSTIGIVRSIPNPGMLPVSAKLQELSLEKRSLNSSYSTPGLGSVGTMGGIAEQHAAKPSMRPSSASQSFERTDVKPVARVQFSPSNKQLHHQQHLTRMTPSSLSKLSSSMKNEASAGRLPALMPSLSNHSLQLEESKMSEDESPVTDSALAAQFLSSPNAASTETHIKEGLMLLRSNLQRILPNALVKSKAYRQQIELLLSDLMGSADRAYENSRAKSSILETALAAQQSAEASEQRYRASIQNLGLDRWGQVEELQSDIRSLELEILDRGSFSVEDATSVGVGLKFGIENVDKDGELQRKHQRTRSETASLDLGSVARLNMEVGDESTSGSISKLVYLKFRRLEQLIYILKRKLAIVENYPHQAEIDRKYGNLQGLLAHVNKLEQDNARLEARLTNSAIKYKEEPLLKQRDLTQCTPAFLHLLVVSLQQTLQSYKQCVEETIGICKESLDTRHPLYATVKAWAAETEKQAKKFDLNSVKSNKRSTKSSAASTPIAGGVGGNLILPAAGGSDRIDIDELYQSIVTSKSATSSVSGNDSAVQSGRSNAGSSNTKVSRAPSTNSAAKDGASAVLQDLQQQLSNASHRLGALEEENQLLKSQLEVNAWVAEILNREGLNPSQFQQDTSNEQENQNLSVNVEPQDSSRPVDDVVEEQQDEDEAEETTATVQDEPLTAEATAAIVDEDENNEHYDKENAADAEASEACAPTPLASKFHHTQLEPSDVDLLHSTVSNDASHQSVPAADSNSVDVPRYALSSLSRRLLSHLRSYSSELSRYQSNLSNYHELFESREKDLASAESDRVKLVGVLTSLIKKHPQLIKPPESAMQSKVTSRRSSISNH